MHTLWCVKGVLMLQDVYENKQCTLNLFGESVACTQAVYFDTETGECGIRLTGIGGGQYFQHNVQGPKDLIALWRTTEALRLLEGVDNLDVIDSIFRVMSYLGDSVTTEIESVSNLIGFDVCDRIMSAQAPDKITKFIEDNQGIRFPPDKMALIAEAKVQHN